METGKREPSAEQADTNTARNYTFGSQSVFGMPFNLRDAGTNLEGRGHDDAGGRQCCSENLEDRH